MWKPPHHHSNQHSADEALPADRSLVGHLLVASPTLANPYFARTAVLIMEHHGDGAAGVVLNRPAGHTIQQVWRQVSSAPCARNQPFHVGGPLPGPMVALHRQKELGEIDLGGDLFVAAQRSLLDQLVAQQSEPFRLFLGHSGWGRGQLEREVRRGAWMILPATAIEVFSPETELWTEAVRQVGASVIHAAIPKRLIPPDPGLN